MKKVQCPNIEKGENVHKHNCYLCNGHQHIPAISALRYIMNSIYILDASEREIFNRVDIQIEYFKDTYGFRDYDIIYDREIYDDCRRGPLDTLQVALDTVSIKKKQS